MKVLSLFSGIGAFEKALKNLSIPFELVGFSELDEYAVKSYCAIHGVPETMNLGDITKIDEKALPKDIDLLTYGFPCQDISQIGSKKGLFNEDGTQTRSGLFFDALRIIEETKPKVAIAENVKNLISKKFNAQFQVILASLEAAGYNNYWKVLNSKDLGKPQNRERIIIVSIRKDIDTSSFKFPESFPLVTKMGNYCEGEVDEKFYLSQKMIEYILDIHNVQKGTKWEGRADSDVLNPTIAHTLSVRGACGNQRAGVSNFLIDGFEDNVPVKVLKEHYIKNQNLRIRKLTPKECFRLMGFSDEDFAKAEAVNSNTQLYKQAGNSIVVDVIAHIFTHLKELTEDAC